MPRSHSCLTAELGNQTWLSAWRPRWCAFESLQRLHVEQNLFCGLLQKCHCVFVVVGSGGFWRGRAAHWEPHPRSSPRSVCGAAHSHQGNAESQTCHFISQEINPRGLLCAGTAPDTGVRSEQNGQDPAFTFPLVRGANNKQNKEVT